MPTKWQVAKVRADPEIHWVAYRIADFDQTITDWSSWDEAFWYAHTQAAREARL